MSKYSVVIPVFNSEKIVAETIQRIVSFFDNEKLSYEIILVNDGSTDSSWEVIAEKAKKNPNIIAIDLLKNYGQHNANFCGFNKASGDYLITMDDDLQNPPEEIIHLINKSKEGHDVVFGQFKTKRHAGYRRFGTKLIGVMNNKIFGKPKGLILSNFRIIEKNVVERICSYQTSYPYIPGLVLMFSRSASNVLVEHQARPVGKSGYGFLKTSALISRILFNYSSYPLRLVALIGLLISASSFLMGLFFLIKGLLFTVAVPGWTTVVVLLSFFNGVTLLIMGMLGEYLIRLINQTSGAGSYQVREVVAKNG